MARRNVSELIAGAAVLAVAIGFLGYAVAHTGRTTVSGYQLTAKFDHIDGLNDGSDVRLAGVKVGSVTGEQIDPQTYQAVVTLSVQPSIKLPKDSSAEITSDGLLGGKYLSLTPGGDTAILPPGGQITITQSAVSLEQLLGKFIFSITDLSSETRKQQQGGEQGQGQGQPPKAAAPRDGASK
jgi:phospholipid/cholesterol/gamma-HCH transport system substrate-binding protein